MIHHRHLSRQLTLLPEEKISDSISIGLAEHKLHWWKAPERLLLFSIRHWISHMVWPVLENWWNHFPNIQTLTARSQKIKNEWIKHRTNENLLGAVIGAPWRVPLAPLNGRTHLRSNSKAAVDSVSSADEIEKTRAKDQMRKLYYVYLVLQNLADKTIHPKANHSINSSAVCAVWKWRLSKVWN